MKLILMVFLVFCSSAYSKQKYRTYFENCPSRTAGKLTLELLNSYEKNQSLYQLKNLIDSQKMMERSFVSQYHISRDPLGKQLNFSYKCPLPLYKVQVYTLKGDHTYSAILAETGQLLDPTYEVLLRRENKLSVDLPTLSLTKAEDNSKAQQLIADIHQSLPEKFRQNFSEIIVNEEQEMTVILSIKGHPTSAFLGKDFWGEKVEKLRKIVSYLESKKKIPALINLTDRKKVVVKFSDNL